MTLKNNELIKEIGVNDIRLINIFYIWNAHK